MPIKTYRPTSPGRRLMTGLTYEEVTTINPVKRLLKRLKKHAGRNNSGKLTIRHQGGGYIKQYRMVDFNQTDKMNISATIKTIEYDPGRSSFIMLVCYTDGEKRYNLAPEGAKVGDVIVTKIKARVQSGNRMTLSHIPIGYSIFNLELVPGKGGQMIKSAGSSGKLVSLEGKMAQVQLPSGEVRMIPKECFATIGVVSNVDHSNVSLGKAGRKRHMGWRPTVRGKAMNPVEHPHGGGEGAQPIGLTGPRTPWGKPANGYKTRDRKKYSTKWIIKKRPTRNK
ncbi:MAG: 50S ribosomal protein L2, large subunit ribosomal protein L2 [Candidatus Peregrinibacteria bacterium GW2011_GWC2_39_14]|nr:MAG: 50S ribosomal protein L2 [Candidatus Peregrinibacteria bacterium GW2011_GWA2_38_36]KKR06861.1 MAG: 50S ribosomal protein L2, large subunit ribosomal protein L2 [Candidatus Peregrinibacteria bacterium GW2011_GWC2_39_14]